MKSFLVGMAIGIPAGMLIADTLIFRSGRGAERRIRDDVRRDLNAASADLSPAEVVDRVAADAREGSSRARDKAILNQVTREELLSVLGIGPILADRILNGRPYRYDEEVVERKILNRSTFDQLHRQVIAAHERSA